MIDRCVQWHRLAGIFVQQNQKSLQFRQQINFRSG
jgi:hypothetical protein